MAKRYFLKKVSDYAIVGGMGALLITSFSGCEDKSQNNQSAQSNAMTTASQKQGAFVIVEKTSNGDYKIVDEYPSSHTTIVLREDGKERILSKQEIDELVAQEAKKIDQGTSNLTNPSGMGGMSLGETLLASAAGAVLGSYIGNKLFNNSNYQNQRKASYKSPQTYSKSVNSFNKASNRSTSSRTNSNSKSGYFGNSKSRSYSSSRFGS